MVLSATFQLSSLNSPSSSTFDVDEQSAFKGHLATFLSGNEQSVTVRTEQISLNVTQSASWIEGETFTVQAMVVVLHVVMAMAMLLAATALIRVWSR